jgi:hypothetical protein
MIYHATPSVQELRVKIEQICGQELFSFREKSFIAGKEFGRQDQPHLRSMTHVVLIGCDGMPSNEKGIDFDHSVQKRSSKDSPTEQTLSERHEYASSNWMRNVTPGTVWNV